MEACKLAGLKPQSVFYYFEELCKIPHGSGNTKQISDYLVSFAREQELRYIQDESNNVIIFAEGTCGLEDRPPVILQGHMDMVCEKDPSVSLDMEKEGLNISWEGDYIHANGTTLGGDNGIAVAYALAILADKTIPHPPLEVVITVDEEIGMLGAEAMDTSVLKGRTFINMDSEDEGVFTVGCAGGGTATLSLPAPRRAVYGPCIRLVVDGLQGGHSGAEIHKNLGNANKIMGEFLSRVQGIMPLCLTAFSGGAKDNAIPRSCQATLVAMGVHIERINGIAEKLQAEIREQYDEPDAVVYGEDVDALGGNALSTEDTAKVIALLCATPNGVQTMNEDIPNLVQTSLNLGVAKLSETMDLTFCVRSSVNAEKVALMEKLRQQADFYGAAYCQAGDYPAWEYRKESALRDTMVATYHKLYGNEPEIVVIHAGLECGLFSEKLPGLDCVSIGPNMKDIHTSREKLSISSVASVWNYLLEVLKSL